MSRFYVQNFGCRATQADGAAIERQFLDQGLRPALDSAEADIVVINTCTVTAQADRDARAAIRRLHRQNPERQIIVTGCYAQRAPQEVAALPGVSRVIGNSHKHELVEAGYLEVVISGINLGRWGRDLHDPRRDSRPRLSGRAQLAGASTGAKETVPYFFASDTTELSSAARSYRFENLIHAILAQTPLERLRISSVEPMDWSNQLIALMAESTRIAKHAHVPLQSGSDSVLRRMHRRYRPWHYREKIEKIRAAMPTAAIG